MTPDALAEALSQRFGDDVTTHLEYDMLTADVPPSRWVEAVTIARDELGCTYFDWLTAVDELDGGFAIVTHLYSPVEHHHLLLRTRLGREEPSMPTITPIFHGASWHERETFEMFGIEFEGHPHLVPLLLPDGFEGHPLRKDFVLAARVAKAWPGAKEPGESEHEGIPARRRMQPPGVPEPGTWGPAGGGTE